MHDSKLDDSSQKRDVSAGKGKNDAAKGVATIHLPNWYQKAELSISAALRPSAKPKSQKVENVWSMRRIRGF